ncbi:MAG: hypothetical protein H6741_21065 [Alphaproteobacteria bacterium]|nr:hypothetical protein [Alphaproteobacteria bacterium]
MSRPWKAMLPPPLAEALRASLVQVDSVPGLSLRAELLEACPTLYSAPALRLLAALGRATRQAHAQVLEQRRLDRAFMDAAVAELAPRNADRAYDAPDYETLIGLRDAAGRVVLGPTGVDIEAPPVQVPPALQGEQVTLFGPPDSAKMCINAMNAWHRRRPDEPAVVTELVEASGQVPRWGADSEDSKTPLPLDLARANQNLSACAAGELRFEDRGKTYQLMSHHLSTPIKRVPGLHLPDLAVSLDGEPLPLHLTDLVLHAYANRARPEALTYYVPKLENEEEAAYLAGLLRALEAALAEAEPGYDAGSIRLFIVFESPRSIFRIREIAAALHPWFVGGSLGWHDFLASTARAFRRDPRYRIPVKADPDIVIRHIKESHEILAQSLGPMGAVSIGGMYGTLFLDGDPASYQASMVGFVRDVITQMKRGLTGYWVAHPDFVRVGLALVEAWRRLQRGDGDAELRRLVGALVPDPVEQEPLLGFVFGEDVPGLDTDDPRYLRGVLAADLELSPVIANDDPEELRYNLFQALQYLTDWLRGNGCVALPATLRNRRGETVLVRVMDDLATTERSRWELWAEVAHGRVTPAELESLLAQEAAFIREARETDSKKVAVPWDPRWSPVAVRLLRQLVLDPEPPEFVTELLMAFTLELIRDAEDPWAVAQRLCPGKYTQTGA